MSSFPNQDLHSLLPSNAWWAAGGPAAPPNYPIPGELFQESEIFKLPTAVESKLILPSVCQTEIQEFSLTPLEELKRPKLLRSVNRQEVFSRDSSPISAPPSKKTTVTRKRRSRAAKDSEILPGHYFFPYNGKKYMIPEGTIVYPFSSLC